MFLVHPAWAGDIAPSSGTGVPVTDGLWLNRYDARVCITSQERLRQDHQRLQIAACVPVQAYPIGWFCRLPTHRDLGLREHGQKVAP